MISPGRSCSDDLAARSWTPTGTKDPLRAAGRLRLGSASHLRPEVFALSGPPSLSPADPGAEAVPMNRANTNQENVDAEFASAKYALIDEALERFRGRSLVSGTEIVDFLLDLRGGVDIEGQLERLTTPG
jgi:hypothetical protein